MPPMLPIMLNVRGRKSTEQVSGCHGISSASASPALEPEYRIGNSGADAAEVATECVLGASRSSAFGAPLSPSVPADPQRCSPATRQEKSRHENSGRASARKSPAKCGRCAFSLSCFFGDDEVAEIGSLFRGSFSPEDEQLATIFSSVRAVFLTGFEMQR